METETISGIRRGTPFKTFLGALSTIAAFLLILFLVKSPVLQQVMNPFSLSLFLIFGVFFIIAFLKFIDRKPLLVISKEGLWVRKSRLPFSGLQQIDWNDIARCRLRVVHIIRNGTTRTLVIERKSSDKKYFLDLRDIKTDEKELLVALKSHTPNADFVEENDSEDES
jgi:hypothetical protein